jgi:hypothetical protein
MQMPAGSQNLTSSPSGDGAAGYSTKVGEYSAEQAAKIEHLAPIFDCTLPETRLAEAAKQYIPKELYECDPSYKNRLSRAFTNFSPHYVHLRNLVVGAAIAKEIRLEDDADPEWGDFVENCTLEGASINSFTKLILSTAVDAGWSGILVDYPDVDPNLSLAEERQQGLRPYFVPIRCEEILGFRSEVSTEQVGGRVRYGQRITQLRIRDWAEEPDPDDEFMSVRRPSVRVYDQPEAGGPCRYRLFVSRDTRKGLEVGGVAGNYVLEKEGFLSVPFIPFVPVYGGHQIGFMRARPLLYDIARLNIAHWQLSADLAHQIHLTACPKLVISGVAGQVDIEMGPDRNLIFSDPGARAQWVGAPTDGLQSVMSRIGQIETQMQSLAVVSMSMQRSGVESAMSKLLERAQGDSQLAVIVSTLEDSLNRAMEMAAAYRGIDAPKLVVSKDFSPLTIESAQVTVYSSLVTAGLLSHRTFLSVMQQGEVFEGVMVDGQPWSVDAEMEQLGEYEAVTPLDQLELEQSNREEDLAVQQSNREQDLAQQEAQQAGQAQRVEQQAQQAAVAPKPAPKAAI